jgi:hypothetical protein
MTDAMTALGLLLGVSLTGCGATSYHRLPWAKVSGAQAYAECQETVQAYMTVGFDTCMEAKGWKAQ